MNCLEYYTKFWHPGRLVDSLIEERGIRINVALVKSKLAAVESALVETSNRWDKLHPGINPRSSEQLSTLLYGTLGYPPPPNSKPNAKTGYYNTAKDCLQWLMLNVPEARETLLILQEIKDDEKSKQLLEGLLKYEKDGRVHTILSSGTTTLRHSSKNPNLQQITGGEKDKWGIRECFVADPGHVLIITDQSQLEARIFAHWMRKFFDDDSLWDAICGGDIHSTNVRYIYGSTHPWMRDASLAEIKKKSGVLRGNAKAGFYSLCFGATPFGLARTVTDEKGSPIGLEAAEVIDKGIKNGYPSFGPTQEYFGDMARDKGYSVTITGRRLYLPQASKPRVSEGMIQEERQRFAKLAEIKGWSTQQISRAKARNKAAERIMKSHRKKSMSNGTQGSGMDIMTAAGIRMERDPDLKRMGARIVLPVHDEFVTQVPREHAEEAQEIVKHHMANPFRTDVLNVNLESTSGIGENWAAGH